VKQKLKPVLQSRKTPVPLKQFGCLMKRSRKWCLLPRDRVFDRPVGLGSATTRHVKTAGQFKMARAC
jgi:hypothetical protein